MSELVATKDAVIYHFRRDFTFHRPQMVLVNQIASEGPEVVTLIHLSPEIHKTKIARRDAARRTGPLVNTGKSGSRARPRRGAASSRGHRALELTNAAFLAAMFTVDLFVLGAIRYCHRADLAARPGR